MATYCVLYRPRNANVFDPPEVFVCDVGFAEHAEEQVMDANPGAEIVYINLGDDPGEAYREWGYVPYTPKTPTNIIAQFRKHWNGTTEELADALESFFYDVSPVVAQGDYPEGEDYFVNHYGVENLES
jgi:hypothetical protein